jgi:hypothetical protein
MRAPATSSLEMVQVVQIPQGWRATAIKLDVRNTSGTLQTRNLNAYKVYNYDIACSAGALRYCDHSEI